MIFHRNLLLPLNGSKMKSYYDLLQVEPDADIETIKRAFHRLAKRFHPDISDDNGEFLKILTAYKTLIDERKRALYNTLLSEKPVFRDVLLPKNRLEFALSLADVARLRVFNRGKTGRRTGMYNPKGYDVMVRVKREELAGGARIYIDIPSHVVCPLCRGSRVYCPLCSGKGHIVKAVPVPVDLPREARNGEIISVYIRDKKSKEYAYYFIDSLRIKITIF